MFAGVKETNKKALKFCGKDRWLKIENMFVDFRKIERGAPLPEIHVFSLVAKEHTFDTLLKRGR